MENVTAKPILIPGINRASIAMLSQQYGLDRVLLSNRYNYYKDEFRDSVVTVDSEKDFESMLPPEVQFVVNHKRGSGAAEYLFTNCAHFRLIPGRTVLFSETAVNKLLELSTMDSKRGKKTGTRSEPSGTPGKSRAEKPKQEFSSEEEERLCLNLAKAYKSGEPVNVLTAAMALDSYRQRSIAELEEKLNESDNRNRLHWTNRATSRKLVSALSEILGEKVKSIQSMLYYRLIHDYSIPLEERGKKPLINGLKDEEWYLLYQSFADICREKYLNTEQVMAKAGVDTKGLSIMLKY